jgi:hypothetical protein
MTDAMRFSACHNAAVTGTPEAYMCAACGKPCELADTKAALAAHEAEGRTPEQILGTPTPAAEPEPDAAEEKVEAKPAPARRARKST